MDGDLLFAFVSWWNTRNLYGGVPAKGTMSGALVVLNHLKSSCDLSIESHTARGGSQISGASGSTVKKILAEHGEIRPFVSEGGRTNRGLRGDIKALLDALAGASFCELTEQDRFSAIMEMQRYIVNQIREWHNRQRIILDYDDKKTTRELVHQVLAKARERGQVGPVAQYLVGAKLQIRYPDLQVENDSYSTSDSQLGRSGDFVIGDTAFHVTVSPMDKVYERCQANLRDGMRAYLLVPNEIMQAARTNADSVAPQQISVESIESFVGGNVDEISCFSKADLEKNLLGLIATYNTRVDEIEIDKSMLLEPPSNLQKRTRRQSRRNKQK